MRADTLTDTFTALRELPRAVLHSVAELADWLNHHG